MSLYIGRNPTTRDVETRNYRDGKSPAPGFRTPAQLVERIEELERLLKYMRPKGSVGTPHDPLSSIFGVGRNPFSL